MAVNEVLIFHPNYLISYLLVAHAHYLLVEYVLEYYQSAERAKETMVKALKSRKYFIFGDPQ